MCARAQTYKAQREGKGEGERELLSLATNLVVNFIASFVETLRTESTKFTTKGLGSWRGFNLVASIIANFVGLSWTKRPS